MAVKYQDYYKTLGVDRDAGQAQINKAYKKLARKFHPDVNKDPGAEAKFKEIGEAYAVLKDPEKRKLYDSLGANWKAGQDFRPPPDWGEMKFDFGGGGGGSFAFGDFSDFFESIFGGARGGGSGGRSPFSFDFERGSRGHDFSGFGGRAQRATGPRDTEAAMPVSLEDIYHGATRTISLQPANGSVGSAKTIQIKIPAGIKEGSTIRLKGQGEAGADGRAGDLLLRVSILPHQRFRARGFDIYTEVPITPWEAALGATIDVKSVDSTVKVKVPPGAESGLKLRLKNKGLLKGGNGRGDLFVELKIVAPKELTKEERELLEKLSTVSKFNPREKSF